MQWILSAGTTANVIAGLTTPSGTTCSATFVFTTPVDPDPAHALDICNYLNALGQSTPGSETSGAWHNDDLRERIAP